MEERQPGITWKHCANGLQCGHIIIMHVIVFMCSPVHIIVVVEGNKTNVHPTQGKYGHKTQKGEPAASPLYTNKARIHTSIISFLFLQALLFVLFTALKRRICLFKTFPQCSTCVRDVMI